jgi:class I lanthipeptide synthase
VGKWGQQLCDTGAASRLTLATYFPEVGRYGHGAAMDAAEAVFAADSRAVVLAMRLLPPRVIDPVALTAVSMMNIADGFHANPDQASSWLLEHLDTRAARSADRAVADQTATWAIHGTLPNGLPLPARLAEAWQERRAALTSYRRSLPDNADIDRGLLALLHMHHNRARRIDRADEAICLRLARQAALGRRARNSGGRS